MKQAGVENQRGVGPDGQVGSKATPTSQNRSRARADSPEAQSEGLGATAPERTLISTITALEQLARLTGRQKTEVSITPVFRWPAPAGFLFETGQQQENYRPCHYAFAICVQ